MPWKATKLSFVGLPVRRRTLYVITLFFAVAAVPATSWALLAMGSKLEREPQIGLFIGMVVTLTLALNGWRLILKHNIVLFWEEARVIWPGTLVLLLAATGAACLAAIKVIPRGQIDYVVPLSLGGIFLIFLVVRCAKLGSHLKRSEVVRGDSGRRRSRSGLPTVSAAEESVVEPSDLDDNDGLKPPTDGTTT